MIYADYLTVKQALMNSFLYISIVLIWGSTWIAIYFQLGEVPILVSIFYRFALASLLLMPFMLLTKRLQKASLEDHGFFLLQELCLFSLNFICFYYATSFISSGLVSVIFSLACIYNAVNNRIFYTEPITRTIVLGSVFGLIGLSLIFYPELNQTQFDADSFKGIALSLLGTLFFSFANIISKRNSNKGLKAIYINCLWNGLWLHSAFPDNRNHWKTLDDFLSA